MLKKMLCAMVMAVGFLVSLTGSSQAAPIYDVIYADVAAYHGANTESQWITDNAYINKGIGLEKFDPDFKKFVKDILHLMHPIVTILTAIAGLQIAFGITDGKKLCGTGFLVSGLP